MSQRINNNGIDVKFSPVGDRVDQIAHGKFVANLINDMGKEFGKTSPTGFTLESIDWSGQMLHLWMGKGYLNVLSDRVEVRLNDSFDNELWAKYLADLSDKHFGKLEEEPEEEHISYPRPPL